MRAPRQKYIKSPRDTALEEGLRFLIERAALFMPDLTITDDCADDDFFVEGRSVTVLGQSVAGKSIALGRVLASHPLLPDYGQPTCPVIVSAPAPCTLKALGRAILTSPLQPIPTDPEDDGDTDLPEGWNHED